MSTVRLVLVSVILAMGLWLIAIVAHADIAPRAKDRRCIDRAHFAMQIAETRSRGVLSMDQVSDTIVAMSEKHPELGLDGHELDELIACLRRVWAQGAAPEVAFDAELHGCMGEVVS